MPKCLGMPPHPVPQVVQPLVDSPNSGVRYGVTVHLSDHQIVEAARSAECPQEMVEPPSYRNSRRESQLWAGMRRRAS
jgi:hypothetical protein